MSHEENLFVGARKISGMNQQQAATVCGLGLTALYQREQAPGEFRLRELKNLVDVYGEGARATLYRAIDLFLCRES